MRAPMVPSPTKPTCMTITPRPWRSSRPVQACQDRLAHHPILVLLGQEFQFLGEVRDALLIGRFGERVGQVGAPVAAPRTEGIEAALQVLRHVTERISLL